jgi:hypothetical protein
VTCVHDNEREREFGTVCGECVEINNGTMLGIFEFREEERGKNGGGSAVGGTRER